MIILNLDWISILENTISNLSVGLILGFVGYFIWKKQHTYQKRLEIYTDFIPQINKIVANIEMMYEKDIQNIYTKYDANDLYNNILPMTEKFLHFYGLEYSQPIYKIIQLLQFKEKRKEFKEEAELKKHLLGYVMKIKSAEKRKKKYKFI